MDESPEKNQEEKKSIMTRELDPKGHIGRTALYCVVALGWAFSLIASSGIILLSFSSLKIAVGETDYGRPFITGSIGTLFWSTWSIAAAAFVGHIYLTFLKIRENKTERSGNSVEEDLRPICLHGAALFSWGGFLALYADRLSSVTQNVEATPSPGFLENNFGVLIVFGVCLMCTPLLLEIWYKKIKDQYSKHQKERIFGAALAAAIVLLPPAIALGITAKATIVHELRKAAKTGNYRNMRLIARFADLKDPEGPGPELLDIASDNGASECVSFLLSKGVRPSLRKFSITTPLFNAALNGHKDAVDVLIKGGADVNDGGFFGSPLTAAARKGRLDIIQLLIEKGSDVNAIMADNERFGFTALHWAVTANRDEVVKLLLEKGADPNGISKSEQTSLHFAADKGHTRVIDVLIKGGAKTDEIDAFGLTPIRYAIYNKKHDAIKALAESGAALDLHAAAALGRLEELKDLLRKHPKSVNTKSCWSNTPLHLAAQYEKPKAVQILTEAGADPNIVNQDGYTPFHLSVQKSDMESVSIMLANGASLGPVGWKKTPALHKAMNVNLIDLLCKNGADPNKKDSSGDTALHLAARYTNIKIIKALLKHGADVTARNNKGQTPFDCVGEKNFAHNEETEECLREAKQFLQNKIQPVK